MFLSLVLVKRAICFTVGRSDQYGDDDAWELPRTLGQGTDREVLRTLNIFL